MEVSVLQFQQQFNEHFLNRLVQQQKFNDCFLRKLNNLEKAI